MKHTPGPWEIEKESLEEYWIPQDHYNVGPAFGIDTIADARLIAAAPDLLEALELMLDRLLDTEGTDGAWETEAKDKARAAIAKATGETA